MIRDEEARETLITEAIDLLNNEQRRHTLSQNIAKMARPDAARHIAEEIEKMIL
jgi:UDP-N-acetylglucosamine--N-acetylmuramyl-(pentapeptide) pyrophosphoryl-undecaprenol N-acetylglucosamine transferase